MPARKPSATSPRSLVDALSALRDPRSHRSQRHPLVNIVVIAVCGVICGADNWVAIEAWAKSHEKWLSSFLDMSQGVPSHDTFGRVFSVLSSKAFQEAFIAWAEGLDGVPEGKAVATCRSSVRRTYGRGKRRDPLHRINAWWREVRASLGQAGPDLRSDEIREVPEQLQALYLQGAIVTLGERGS